MFKAVINWIVFLLVIAAVYFAVKYFPALPTVSGGFCVLLALSCAFSVKELLHWNKKPFDCVKCLTGWFSLVFAFLFGVYFPVAYLFIGLFTGAIFEAIKMRWL